MRRNPSVGGARGARNVSRAHRHKSIGVFGGAACGFPRALATEDVTRSKAARRRRNALVAAIDNRCGRIKSVASIRVGEKKNYSDGAINLSDADFMHHNTFGGFNLIILFFIWLQENVYNLVKGKK